LEIAGVRAKHSRSREASSFRKEVLMVGDTSQKKPDPNISPYLQQPLRTLKKAQQDSDDLRHHGVSPHLSELGPRGDIELDRPPARVDPGGGTPQGPKKQS
jgi:hypothetical protein